MDASGRPSFLEGTGSESELRVRPRTRMDFAKPFPNSVTFAKLFNLSVSLALKMEMFACSG